MHKIAERNNVIRDGIDDNQWNEKPWKLVITGLEAEGFVQVR